MHVGWKNQRKTAILTFGFQMKKTYYHYGSNFDWLFFFLLNTNYIIQKIETSFY